MFTSLPRVTPPGEMRDGRCEVLPGGRQPFSHCCHDDAGCRELPGPRSYPSQRQRLVSAVGPPPRQVHSGGPEGSAGLHHGSAPSFSLGQCWSQSSPTAPVPEASAQGLSVTGNQAENHGGGQRRPAESLNPVDSTFRPWRASGEPTGLQHFPSSFKKSQTEDRPRLPTQVSAHSSVCSLSGTRDLNAASGSQHRSQQPTFRALPTLTTGQAPRGWRALLPSPPLSPRPLLAVPSSMEERRSGGAEEQRSGSFWCVAAFLPHVCRQHPSHAASLALPPALLLLAF